MLLNWVIVTCLVQVCLGGILSGVTAFMLWMLGGDEPRSTGVVVLDWAVFAALSVPFLSFLGILLTIFIYNMHPSKWAYWLALFPLIPFSAFCSVFFLLFFRSGN